MSQPETSEDAIRLSNVVAQVSRDPPAKATSPLIPPPLPQQRAGNVEKGQKGWCSTILCCFCNCEDSDDISAYRPGMYGYGSISPANNQQISNEPLLPPYPDEAAPKKTIVLDLDETLIHASFKPIAVYDFIVEVEIEGTCHQVYVSKRPHVDEFLKEVGRLFEVVIFTASLSKYADPVIDNLDPSRIVNHRLFREGCTYHMGNFVKDMSRMGRDIKDVFIIDNSPVAYFFQPQNAIGILSWFDNPEDEELMKLLPLLKSLTEVEDVRTILQPINTLSKMT